MAITITDARQIASEADSNTGWTGSATVNAVTSPTPVESTNALGMAVSSTTDDAYTTITSYDMSGGVLVYVWMQANGDMDTTANGGIMIQLGDGTNRIGFHVGGSDKGAFRVESGPVAWQCFVLDTANLPANSTAFAGSLGSLSLSAITQVGVAFKTLSKALGGSTNCFWDIIRIADPGEGITVYGGTSGTPETMATVATESQNTGNQRAHGVVRQLGAGVYGIQGNFGWDASANDVYFDIDTETLAWEDRSFSSTNYYRVTFAAAAVQNAQLTVSNSTFQVPSTAGASLDLSDADIDLCTVTGNSIIGFDQGILTAAAGDDWTGNNFISCGQITHNGCDLSASSFSGYEGTAGTAYLVYNLAVDPDGELDNLTFTKGTATTHAIELGTNTPSTITLRGWTVSGFNTSDGQNDSVIYNNSGKSITINVVGNTGTISYRNGTGASTTINLNPVTHSINVKNQAGSNVSGASVFTWPTDNTGPIPYEESVSITRSSSTATVTHTAHGLVTNQYVWIQGADQAEYNGVFQVTVTDANTYTYTVSGTPASPATGTITATGVILYGTTDASGNASYTRSYSADQEVQGRVRLASSSPYYQPATYASTIDSANGSSVNVVLLDDE